MEFKEPARDVPVVEEADVVVCGGGPAGIAAAVAAARQGARTRLIEMHGALGGVWTTGALAYIIDSKDKPGLMAEIVDRLDQAGYREQRNLPDYTYDVEGMKRTLDTMAAEAGVDVRLHTSACAAGRDSDNRLAVVVTESKSGREAWSGKAFVDATGDGTLAALAGCGFDMGHPETGNVQPLSLMAILTGLDSDEVDPFTCNGNGKKQSEAKTRLNDLMSEGGFAPTYAHPTLFRIHDGLFAFMANHEYNVKCDNAQALSDATVRARAEVHRLADGLRSLGGIWKDLRIVSTGAQIGIREGRRIHGRYTVTKDDMLEGARFEDAVCRVHFGIDVHSTDPSKTRAIEEKTQRTRPYDIPLRAQLARDVDGLLLAGRCISGDFLAHSSYRVTGNAVMLGQSAGVTAALSVRANCLPHDVPWVTVQEALSALNGKKAEPLHV